jgi:hypothetical protein
VVVGAGPEPGRPVVELVASREHEDGHAAAGGDDAFGDLAAGATEDARSRAAMPLALTRNSSSALSPSAAMSAAIASQPRPEGIASAISGSSSTINTRTRSDAASWKISPAYPKTHTPL